VAEPADTTDEKSLTRAEARRTFRRLLPFVRPHRRTLTGALLTVFVIVVCHLAGPMALAWFIDDGVIGGDRSIFLMAAALYFLTFLVAAGTGYLQFFVLSRMGLRIITALKEKVFGHVLRLSTRFHDRNPVGKLIARTESDAETVKELFSHVAVQIVQNAITFTATLAVMLVIDWRVAGILLLLVPVLAVAAWWFLKTIRPIYREGRKRYAELTGMITEYVQGVPVVQQFDQKERALRLLDEKNDAKFRWDLKAWYLDYSFWGVFLLAEGVAVAAILWFGSGQLLAGEIKLGVLVMFLEYTRRVFEPIIVLGEQLNQVQRALASADRVFDILDTQSDVSDAPEATGTIRLDREIRLEDVSFSYDGKMKALDGVSLTVAKGERVALVGPSGGGKTTLVGLLCRFLDPTDGRVLVDGRDLRSATQKAWRERIGLVLQDIYLFPGTVLDNLRVLDDKIPQGAVERAARAVTADRFIETLPGGYRADLAERGANLSLGERQVLSFARALTSDPDLLILDEATSSVDSETESRIQRSLDSLLEGRTAVIVAHRLSTVRKVDRILVVKGGKIVEEGSHEELYARDGLYRELYDLQTVGNGRGGRP